MWKTVIGLAGALTLCASVFGAIQHPIYEPTDPQGAKAAPANLLLNAKVTASGHWDKQKPELVVDGKKDNPANHWACEKLPVWIQADMGKLQKVSRITVYPYWGDGRIYKYKVEGSKDGQDYVMLGDMTANSITASAEGNTFAFASQELRYIRVTFLENSRGAENGGHLVEMEAYAESNAQPYLVAVPHTKRYGKTDLPSRPDPEKAPVINLSGWRGERVHAQVLICAPGGAKQVRLSTKGSKIEAKASFLRYTQGNKTLYADIIDDIEVIDIPAGTLRPVWLTIDIPNDPAYRASEPDVVLTVSTEDDAMNIPIVVTAVNATIPAPKDWRVHLDLWQHPDAVARWHDVPMWSDAHFALMKPIMKRLANAGQKAITAALINEGWNEQTYDKFRSMVTWIKQKDGSWRYDYTIFDKWVQFAMDCGIDKQINCYTMIPWDLRFQYYDEAKGIFIAPKLDPASKEYEAHWGPFLKDFEKHVRNKGWLKVARIAMDERPDRMMRPALAILKKYAPELQVASAVNAPTNLTKDLADLSVAISHYASLEKVLADRKSKGYKSTIYVCTSPARPNTFTHSNLAEGTWLMHYSAALEFDGFLRWAFMSWVENPLVNTDYVRWPTGDCFLVYPGNRGAVRFETLRDGIEDFEKINILRDAAAKSNRGEAKSAIESLNAYLRATYTWERGKNPIDYDKDIAETVKRIDAAASVILKSP